MLPANDFVGGNQQATAAAALGVSRLHYTLAGGSAGTAGLTPAQIEENAEAASERSHTTQVPAPIGERERKRYKEREKERVRERERIRSIL